MTIVVPHHCGNVLFFACPSLLLLGGLGFILLSAKMSNGIVLIAGIAITTLSFACLCYAGSGWFGSIRREKNARYKTQCEPNQAVEAVRKSGFEFTIHIDRSMDRQMGIDIDFSTDEIIIEKIKEGLVKEWNIRNPGKVVKTGDRIVAVNGASNADSIINCCKQKQLLDMTILALGDVEKIYYLPKTAGGVAIMIDKGEGDGMWHAYNGELKSVTPGVQYRKSMDIEDKAEVGLFLKWGGAVRGESAGPDWVKCYVHFPRPVWGFDFSRQESGRNSILGG